MTRLFLCEDEAVLPSIREEDLLFPAAPLVKHCVGCFGCWLKTPGKCAIRDRCGVMPAYLTKCDEFIIISPIWYGGYSQRIKAVLDRSIGYMLPYFRMLNGEMHHQMRSAHGFALRVYFYGPCDAEEQDIARRMVRGNALNFGATGHSVSFLESEEAVRRALA